MTTGADGHAALHHLAGAYVLGGLDLRDRELFEHHLALCGLCVDEMASMQSLAGLLDAVPLDDVLALGSDRPTWTPESLEAENGAAAGTLMAKLAKRRRRSRWRAAAMVSGAAAACLAIGFMVGTAGAEPVKPEASYAANAASGPQVQLGLVKKPWGTELALAGHDLPVQGILSLWVKDKSGRFDRAASWSATARGQAEVVGATPVAIEDMAGAEIRDGRGRTIAVLAPGVKN